MSFFRRSAKRPQRKLNRSLVHLFGKVGLQLGRSAEDLVERSIKKVQEKGGLPHWFRAYKRSEPYSKMDKDGVDFAFYVEHGGDILVNIKSSVSGENNFKLKHPGSKIHVFIVDVRKDEETIYDELIDKLIAWKN